MRYAKNPQPFKKLFYYGNFKYKLDQICRWSGKGTQYFIHEGKEIIILVWLISRNCLLKQYKGNMHFLCVLKHQIMFQIGTSCSTFQETEPLMMYYYHHPFSCWTMSWGLN